VSFLSTIAAEAIGGLIVSGGIVTLCIRFVDQRFRAFQLYYLDPNDPLTPEHKNECTAIRTNAGHYRFRISLTPRRGLEILDCSFAFFDKGILPCTVGRRRNVNDAKISKMLYMNHKDGKFYDANLEIIDKNENCSVPKQLPTLPLSGGTCTYYELEAEVSEILKSWEGILSFRIEFKRDDTHDKRCVRTKFLVANNKTRSPLRSRGKKILNAMPIPRNLEQSIT
jgi:hypothetical protein